MTMIANDARKLMTVKEAAETLHVCVATVYNLMGRGEIDSVKIGRCRRVKASSIARLMAEAPAE